jgi:hypothetical protein
MSNEGEIGKGDVVEEKGTGQTWRVVSNAGGKVQVKGYGMSKTLLLHDVKKAPPRN